MQPHLLTLLACPHCHADLHLQTVTEKDGEHVLEGVLACTGCGLLNPIHLGIPRFVPSLLQKDVKANVLSFGQQWKAYDKRLAENRLEFDSYLQGTGLSLDDLSGLTVLDAGCGSGKFAAIAGECSGEPLVAMDLSDSVEVVFAATRHLANVLVVQGDLLAPPLQPEIFDCIYSIGVLHHTTDPPRSFRTLLPFLKPEGRFFFWLYAKEGNEFYLHWIDPLRQHFTRHWPLAINNMLAWMVATTTWPLLILYGWLDRDLKQEDSLRNRLPMFEYLLYFRRVGFWLWRNTILDKMIPYISNHYSLQELEGWVTDLDLSSNAA